MVKQWLGRVRLAITTGRKKAAWEYGADALVKNQVMINFSAPFSSDSAPSVITVDLFNLGQDSVNFIKKGSHVVLEAGYGDDIGVICEGEINYVYPRVSDSAGEIKSSFCFIEGKNYSKAKDIKLSLGPGTTGKDVINRVAKVGNIKLSEINLKKNKVYSKGYSVDGAPLGVLEEVAKDCGSKLFYKRGRLVVSDIKATVGKALAYDAAHGLIGYPQPLDYDFEEFVPGFSVEMFLNHRINVGQPIKLNSRYGEGGIYYFRSGEHSFDGSSFRTTGEVI